MFKLSSKTLSKKIRSARLQHIRIVLAVGIGLSILVYLSFQAWKGIEQFQRTRPVLALEYLLYAAGFQISGVVLAAWVWHRILQSLGTKTSMRFDFQAFTVSAMARKLPGMVWYAVGRIMLYHKFQYPRRQVVDALFLELGSLTLAGLLSFALSVLGGGQIPIFMSISHLKWLAVALIFAIATLVATTSYWRPWFVNRFALRNDNVSSHPMIISWRNITVWILSEAIVIGLATAVVFSLLHAFDPTTGISVFLPLYGAFGLAVALGPLLVWMPSDLGVKDGIVYVVLSHSISQPVAALLVLSWRAIVTTMELSLGALCGISLGLFRLPIRPSKHFLRVKPPGK